MVKGILKRHSLSAESIASSYSQSSSSSATGEFPKQKRVSFDGSEPTRVFEADEWDRSPAEVTLRLTYKDVVELRELNVCVVRTGPLMMERTPSRRPTRQRTPTPPKRTESPNRASPVRGSSPIDPRLDEHAVHPSTLNGPRPSPTYQYQPFTSQSLPPLLEDASSSPDSPSEYRGRGHLASSSDSYFTFHPESPSHSPPGLPLRAPHLKGLPSPALAPPSPLVLSSSSPPRSPSPKARELPVVRAVSPHQRILGAPKSLPFPTLSRRASVPEELVLEATKGVFVPASPMYKPLGLGGVHGNSSSPTLGTGDVSQVRRSGMSLMGWELRKTGSGSGRRGFGLVRKGSTSA